MKFITIKRAKTFTAKHSNLIVLTSLSLLVSTIVFGSVNKERSNLNKMLDNQKTADKTNVIEVTRELKIFINDINYRLGLRGNKKLAAPIEKGKIRKIDKTDHIHSKRRFIKKEYAFVIGNRVRLRSGNSVRNEIVGHCNYGSKVELLMQSDFKDRVGSMTAPWFLIKKKNGDEGWIFGYYLQNAKPIRGKRSQKRYNFIVPTSGRVSSKFGYRVHPVSKRSHSFHSGIDIAAPTGTPVKASLPGRVVKSGYYRNGYGNLIVIKHDGNFATYYGHLLKRLVKRGDIVKQGEIIGYVDTTGRSTGPHLHFEIRRGSKALDPDGYFR